jgi:hypothetical protein
MHLRIFLPAGCLLALLIAGCSPISVPVSSCPGAIFDLPVSSGTKPTVRIAVDGGDPADVVLDTGMSYNTFFAPDDNYHGQPHYVAEKQVAIPAFKATLTFGMLPVPREFSDSLVRKKISAFIVNPSQVFPEGFAVLDLKRRRFVAFNNEADLRNCFGHGQRTEIHPAEAKVHIHFIDIMLDGKIAGRVSVDTGAYLSEFYNSRRIDAAALPSAEDWYMGVNGERITPLVSWQHSIQIGTTSKQVEKIALHVENRPDTAMGTLGMDALGGSVLIFPPASQHYWELIF